MTQEIKDHNLKSEWTKHPCWDNKFIAMKRIQLFVIQIPELI